MNMKKILSLLLVMGLMLGMAVGCSGSKNEPAPADPPQAEEPVKPEEPGAKTDTGTFLGRIDNNSVEIQISGVPEEAGTKAFQLSNELIEAWDKMGFAEGDQIKIQYEERTDDRPLLLDAEKI